MTPKPETAEQLRELDKRIEDAFFDGGKFVGLKKRGIWYRPESKGYTDRIEEAGRYTREDAEQEEYPRKGSKLEADVASGRVVLSYDERVTIHEFPARKFTTDPAASDALDDEILKLAGGYRVLNIADTWMFSKLDGSCAIMGTKGKHVARVLFALKLADALKGGEGRG